MRITRGQYGERQSGTACRVKRMTNAVGGIGVAVILSLGVLSACSGASARAVRLETYVSQLCEAIGPFEYDTQQKFGMVVRKYTLRLASGTGRREMAKALTAVIGDSRHIVTAMQGIGSPDVSNGTALAAKTLQAFNAIAASDAAWRSELRTRVWRWPTVSRGKRARVLTSLEGRLEVGRLFEALPDGPETQNAMAASPVCREQFGSVPLQSST